MNTTNTKDGTATMNTTTDTKTTAKLAAIVIALFVSLWMLLAPAAADAGQYSVRACWKTGPHGPASGTFTNGGVYYPQDYCNSAASTFPYVYVRPNGNNGPSNAGSWQWSAPAGTYFDSVTFDHMGSPGNGYGGYTYRKPVGGSFEITHVNEGPRTDTFTNVDYFGVALQCFVGSGCPSNTGGPFARIGDVRMSVTDTSAPSVPSTSGSMLSGAWQSGARSINVSGSDVGAGIGELSMFVNGSKVSLRGCSPATTQGWLATLQPCNAVEAYGGSFSAGSNGFTEGSNTVQFCNKEYGNGSTGVESCTSQSGVYIDNIAPEKPTGLAAAQGSDWVTTDDFDLSWTNPAQAHAPIDGAWYRITRNGVSPGAFTFTSGANLQALADRAVGQPGEYTMEVLLRDQAGNYALANDDTTTLRFDNVPPGEADPDDANGWLNRADITASYNQEWQEPIDVPVSGIDGYAFAVDGAQTTDPCAAQGGPDCSAAEINHQGVNNRSSPLDGDDLSEGNNYVHVVPVSGAGLKASSVEHTRLQVDTVDPTSSVDGVPGDWSTGPVALTARGADARSGMQDNDEYPNDDPPATFLQVDGKASSEPDSDVSASINADGVHNVAHWARDLAGNTSAKQAATVKIDQTAPIAYLEQRDPENPELIAAQVGDATSGLAASELQYREGDAGWQTLDAEPTGSGRLEGSLDSNQMKEGVEYRFRVLAGDVAGNETKSNSYADGTPSPVQSGPFRDGTRIKDLTLNGKPNSSKVPYGSKGEVTGKLVDENGTAIGGGSVIVVENYDLGAKFGEVKTETKTNANGVFAFTMRKGPSRSVTATFEGDRKLLASKAENALRLNVGGKIVLKTTKKKVRPGKTVQFKGRIGRRGAQLTKRAKKLVEVQVKVGRKFKTLDKAIRTNSKGRFKLRYRFGRFYTRPTKFKFRAVLLKEAGFPYRPAKSKPKKVTIVPKRR